MSRTRGEVLAFKSEVVFNNFNKPAMRTETHFSDGSVIQKTLSMEDYTELFKMGLVKEDKGTYIDIPTSLPKGFIAGKATEKEDTFKAAFFVPSCKRQYICGTTGEILIAPYPSLLFHLEVKRGRPTYHIFALDSDRFSPDMKLYVYPYGHVETNGSVCMGSCAPHVYTMQNVDVCFDAFFDGVDSGHYYSKGIMAKPAVSLRELVGMAIRRGRFPKAWLMPAFKGNETVKTYLKKHDLNCN